MSGPTGATVCGKGSHPLVVVLGLSREREGFFFSTCRLCYWVKEHNIYDQWA